MSFDSTVRNWQRAIVRDCARILGRPLTEAETRFITSRGGWIALEAIHDTVKGSKPEELEAYLNSEK